MSPTTSGLFGGEELSPQGKLLVLVSFLAQDGVITRNAQCLLKALILQGDTKVLSLLKHLENGGSLADAYYLDQEGYKHLDTFEQLATRNAGRVFEQMEFE